MGIGMAYLGLLEVVFFPDARALMIGQKIVSHSSSHAPMQASSWKNSAPAGHSYAIPPRSQPDGKGRNGRESIDPRESPDWSAWLPQELRIQTAVVCSQLVTPSFAMDQGSSRTVTHGPELWAVPPTFSDFAPRMWWPLRLARRRSQPGLALATHARTHALTATALARPPPSPGRQASRPLDEAMKRPPRPCGFARPSSVAAPRPAALAAVGIARLVRRKNFLNRAIRASPLREFPEKALCIELAHPAVSWPQPPAFLCVSRARHSRDKSNT